MLNPSVLFAQEDVLVQTAFKVAVTAKLTVQALRRNVTVLLGPGGNIAVLTGPDRKLLVDAEIVTSRPHVSEALASINQDPIKQLVNTHWHFDHTGGNDWLHEAGASILAQDNTRKHLSVDTRVEGWHHTFPAAPRAIPSTVFKEDHTLHVNGATLVRVMAGLQPRRRRCGVSAVRVTPRAHDAALRLLAEGGSAALRSDLNAQQTF